VSTSGCKVDGDDVPGYANINTSRRKDFSRTSAAAAIVAGAALIAQGIALASGSKPLTGLDIREWLKASGAKTQIAPGGTAPFGVMPDLTRLGAVPKRGKIKLGPVLGAGLSSAPTLVTVTQLSEGLVGLKSSTSAPSINYGSVTTEKAPGSTIPANKNTSPTMGGSYVEHWGAAPAHATKVFDNPSGLVLSWQADPPATGLPFPKGWKFADIAFTYTPPPLTSDPTPLPQGAFFKLNQGANLIEVGQLHRVTLGGGGFIDRWLLYDNYLLPGGGNDVTLQPFSPNPVPATVGAWLSVPLPAGRTAGWWAYAGYTVLTVP
jgi:hypothetical protein